MQVGDLVKFHDISPNKDDDIGIIIDIKGRDVLLWWARKIEFGRSTIDRLLCESQHFEVIND